jgi:hypothetical protein
MTKRSEILIAARAIIADPERWTQGHLARDANGQLAEPNEAAACSFCAYGAALRAAIDLRLDEREGRLIGSLLDSAARKVKTEIPGANGSLRPIAYLNDKFGEESRTLVLAAYDIAIEERRAWEERR